MDGPEEIPDPEDPSKFTSVGVQVEDNRGSVIHLKEKGGTAGFRQHHSNLHAPFLSEPTVIYHVAGSSSSAVFGLYLEASKT